MIFTDSHAHLSLVAEQLGEAAVSAVLADYSGAYGLALAEGRVPPQLLDPGTEPADLAGRRALALRLAPDSEAAALFLRFAAGIWPSPENLASPQASVAALESAIAADMAEGGRVSAIGEGGLDYHYPEGIEGRLKMAQSELFEAQLSLASRLALPFIVHSREAAADTIAIIRALRPAAPVLIHCFGYGPDEARAFLDLGCYLSFAGNLTFKKSDGLREACALVSEDRLLLETDAPFMNPMPNRGKPSSPADVERSYGFAASLRGVPVASLAETVSRNARRLFG
jgi:Mg-dependent DNase